MTERESIVADRTCPSPERLSALVSGALATDQIDELTWHLSTCVLCSQRLRELKPEPSISSPTVLGPADLPSDVTRAEPETIRIPQQTPFESSAAYPMFQSHLVLGKLGQGGMGVVYDAWDLERGARVALKALPRVDASSLYRFKREFRARADLVHRNLVSLYELVAEGDRWFFTMDRLQGVDLLTHLRRQAFTRLAETRCDGGEEVTRVALDETTPDPEAVDSASHAGSAAASTLDGAIRGYDLKMIAEAFCQLAEGLIVVHDAGLLHRDIKPSNVMVTSEGRVVILDFGLVGEHHESILKDGRPGAEETRTGGPAEQKAQPQNDQAATRVGGTIDYMAPEQAAGLNLGPACDWYSFGVMLHEVLTGVRPFGGTLPEILAKKMRNDPRRPRELAPELPAEWDDLCYRLLSRTPEQRPTGREVLGFLRGWLGVAEPHETDLPASTKGLSRSFVGRVDLLRDLEASAVESCTSGLVIAMVHGRSGVGKSTVISRFLDEIKSSTSMILRGRCHEQESVPYKAIDSLIDDLARQLRRLQYAAVADQLTEELAPLCRLFPVLEGLLPEGHPGNFKGGLVDPVESRRRAFRAFRELFEGLLSLGPLVIAIDDFQWGDVDSALLLSELFKLPRLKGLLLLISYRSEYADRSLSLKVLREQAGDPEIQAALRDYPVEPLSPEETRALIVSALGVPERVDRLAEKLIKESCGNPLFVHELIDQLDSERFATALASGTKLDLSQLFWWRVEDLPDDARRLLSLIALAGQPIPLRTAYQAAGLVGRERAAALALRAGRFVRSTGQRLDDEVETFHDFLRETIVRRIALEERLTLHRALAESLESSNTTDPETLAAHWIGAGEVAKAGHYYAKAASLASDALAFDKAAKLYQLAGSLLDLQGAELASLRRQTAEALANAGRCHEAAIAFRDCALAAEGTPEWSQLQRLSAYNYAISGHFEEGRKAFASILQRVGLSVPRSRIRIIGAILRDEIRLHRRGFGFVETHESAIDPVELERFDVIDAARRGLSMIDPFLGNYYQSPCLLLGLQLGEPRRLVRYLTLQASRASAPGDKFYAKSLEILREAERIAERLDDPEARASADLARGIIEYHVARWRESIDALTRADRFFSSMGRHQAWEQTSCFIFKNGAYLHMGDVASLTETNTTHTARASDRGDLLGLTYANVVVRPHLLMVKDQPESIADELASNLAHWPRDAYLLIDFSALVSSYYSEMYQERPHRALASLDEQWSKLHWSFLMTSQIIRVPTWTMRAMARASAGGYGRQKSLLRKARSDANRIQKEFCSLATPSAAQVRAVVAAAEGDKITAMEQLEIACSGFERLQMCNYALGCRHAIGLLQGGIEGRAVTDEVEATLKERGVANPRRYAAMYHGIGFWKG